MSSPTTLIVLCALIAAATAFVTVNKNPPAQPSSQYGAPAPPTTSINLQGFLATPTELLTLLEGFLKLKGDVVSRFYAIIEDNYELIRSVYNVVVNKAATLHSVSLTGVQILRSILEFVIQCLSQFEITIPSISFDGSHQTSGSVPQPSYGTPSASAGDFSASGVYQR